MPEQALTKSKTPKLLLGGRLKVRVTKVVAGIVSTSAYAELVASDVLGIIIEGHAETSIVQ